MLVRTVAMPHAALLVAGLLWLGATMARAEPPQNASPGIDGKSSFTLSMKVEVESPNRLARRDIMPGDHARTGERVSVTSWADQPVYIYVVHYDPKGWSELLFPNAKPVHVAAGEKIRIPEPGSAFSLVGEPGDMTLRVVGSREPLDEVSFRELRLQWPLVGNSESSRGVVDKQRQKKEPPPPPSPPPPNPSSEAERAPKRDAANGTRGGTQSADAIARTIISSESNGSEKAWLWFTFRQEN